MPRSAHDPTPTERDERVELDLPPDESIKPAMKTGGHPEDQSDEGSPTEQAGRLPDAETQTGTHPNLDEELGGEG